MTKYITKPVFIYGEDGELRHLTAAEHKQYRSKLRQRNWLLLGAFLVFDIIMHFITVAIMHSPAFAQFNNFGN